MVAVLERFVEVEGKVRVRRNPRVRTSVVLAAFLGTFQLGSSIYSSRRVH